MAHSFWLSDRQFARLRPLLPNKVRGVPRGDDRRVISGILHVLAERLSVARCPGGLRSLQDPLQPVRALGAQRGLGRRVHATGRGRGATSGAAGFDAGQGPSVGGRGKRGADQQAIGRSRGGRPTKIHAAVDEAGRPRRLIVRPGHRGDAPVATALVAALLPQRCLADTAYDSDALRTWLGRRGCQPVIPNNPTRKQPPSL